MIFITVGSALPFDRLIRYLDERLNIEADIDEVFFAQTGEGGYVPSNFEFVRFLSAEEYGERLLEATAVISHAGIGTITSVVRLGKPLLVLPRQKLLGELVDDHQLETARRFEELGHLSVLREEESLASQLDRLNAFRPKERIPNRMGVSRTVSEFLFALSREGRGA